MLDLQSSLPTSNRILAGVIISLAILVLTSCSDRGEANKTDNTSSGGEFENTATIETTASPTEATGSPGDAGDVGAPEGTLKEMAEVPKVVLRLEGAPKTSFRGLCSVKGGDAVLGGQVPKRFTFDLGDGKLTCRIQKKGSGGGELKVLLLDGDRTRSVQSVQARGGTINLSYDGQ